MKTLIINTTITGKEDSRALNGLDSALSVTLAMYKDRLFHVTANHLYSKFIYLNEDLGSVVTMRDIDEVANYIGNSSNITIVTHEQWLNANNPGWKDKYTSW